MSDKAPQMDLIEDWRQVLIKDLQGMGYSVPTNEDLIKSSIQYFNALKRRIPQKPRAVERAKQFNIPEHYVEIVQEIEGKILRGDDLNPHLSRRIVRKNFNDMMLNDWGISHLHLSLRIGAHGLVTGTPDLLFIWLSDEVIYLLNIGNHSDWSDQEYLEIVNSNWPNLLSRFRMKHFQLLHPLKEPEDIATFRKIGISTFVSLSDGSVLSPPGGGYQLNGVSSEVMDLALGWRKNIKQFERWIISNFESIRDRAASQGIEFPDAPRFVLQFTESGEPCAVCEEINVAIRLSDSGIIEQQLSEDNE